MADADFNAAPRAAHPYPTASPGYGKRTAPGQPPRRRDDFAHLPAREASIAAFIDRLPEGAAMDAKTLAASIPAYGQAACRTALNRLSTAGHLRRVTERRKGDSGSLHWVTRTYFSRAARDDEWWAAFQAGNVPKATPQAQPQPAAKPSRSQAYDVLASVGRADPRMTLSAADCRDLEELATEWFARGAGAAELVSALTAGLPPEVHHAGALARRRLIDKMPPEPPSAVDPAPGSTRTILRVMECTICRTPGRPEALPGGLCRDCRGEARPDDSDDLLAAHVRTHMSRLRAALRNRERSSA
ncbi:hypothetical protein [Streptomyces sp. ISL-11]|uniref:hypothetical protein n=1 Tax=Streptomyces sp. ISL-11 TaxID=2819174 RepID=UPI001BE9D6B4|nr:hypothetical protein [Streptomyces sp. ISL-11]MBT2384646.1 hypothetical protein [Streptomyces sp. ISL-11]